MRNARASLKILGFIWLTLVLPFAWISIQVIEQLPRKGFPQNLYDTTLGFLFLPGWPILLTSSIFGLLLLATIIAAITQLRSTADETPAYATPDSVITTNTVRNNQGAASQIGSAGSAIIIQDSPGAIINQPQPQPDHSRLTQQKNVLLHRYLNSVIAKCENVNPIGIHQPSPVMLSISVPLQDIFIHIRAVSDRPQFGILREERELAQEIEKLRQRKDLDERTREDYIQRLRAARSRFHKELAKQSTQDITIETVLQELTAINPVAVMLGIPGSGKSTTMRWLALHMARTLCNSGYSLPKESQPVQLPILITIGDYAKAITATASTPQPIVSLKDYLWAELKKIDGTLPDLIEERLNTGQCLLLFDGLDEVGSDDLRRRVTQDLFDFVTSYLSEQQNAQQFNRALVTSRIVGYEPGSFARYAQYTLLDLEDKQIQQFLDSWCPAAERYRIRSGQGMKETLSPQQEQEALRIGKEQRNQLRDALQQNPGIRRLAVNPLMLTILALIQKSNRTLPQRRIELYETVTQTLLDNWNQLKGGKMFSPEEMDLAEDMLSEFAFRLHSTDLPLVREDVLNIARKIMADFSQCPLEQIAQDAVEHFIDTLQRSSSLFVERGQGLYGFIHRTFQEYYVMLYLVDKKHYPTPEALTTFVQERCHTPIWHEPLLLLIAYKSEQRDRDEQQQASALIQTILDAHDPFDPVLQRNLLLAASAIVDCKAWIIDRSLQREVANRLLDLYGDVYDTGRYTELQKDIEKTMLLWLRGQPPTSSQPLPLLEVLYTALCEHTNPQRQLGASKLLATIALDLPTCPATVLHTLVPPLLHLAGVQDWYRQELSCPPEISVHLFTISAHPSSPDIEDYALVALRLLDSNGPAGWLHSDWLRWSKEQPELLQRLTWHALELNYLLTPAAFPARADDPNLNKQLELSNTWKEHAQHDPYSLQQQLLHASSAARYPQAILYKRLLSGEATASGRAWQSDWDEILQDEMQQGRAITFQPCLYLRLLLARNNQQSQQHIAYELLNAIVTQKT